MSVRGRPVEVEAKEQASEIPEAFRQTALVLLPVALMQKLTQEALARNLTLPTLLSEALSEYLARHPATPR